MDKEYDEEIDLQDLVVKGIRFITKNFLFILIWAVIGISSALLYRVLSPTVYKSQMVLSSDILTESYGKVITESVQNLITEMNYSSLGTLLGISEGEASGLKAFDIVAEKKEEKNSDKDKSRDRDQTIFTITISTKNSESLAKLQAGIIQLLQNNDFVTIRLRQRRELYKGMIDRIGSEINSLDSLKKSLFFNASRPKSSETLFVDPSKIYSELIDLYKDKLDYKNDLELSDSVQLIEGFIISKRPPRIRMSILLLYGLFGGVVFAIGFRILSPLYKLSNKTSS